VAYDEDLADRVRNLLATRAEPMKGWVLVAVDRSDEAALAEWVDAGADYAASLPTK
jgi:hypothetical protein